jgi:hypothetical protein
MDCSGSRWRQRDVNDMGDKFPACGGPSAGAGPQALLLPDVSSRTCVKSVSPAVNGWPPVLPCCCARAPQVCRRWGHYVERRNDLGATSRIRSSPSANHTRKDLSDDLCRVTGGPSLYANDT